MNPPLNLVGASASIVGLTGVFIIWFAYPQERRSSTLRWAAVAFTLLFASYGAQYLYSVGFTQLAGVIRACFWVVLLGTVVRFVYSRVIARTQH